MDRFLLATLLWVIVAAGQSQGQASGVTALQVVGTRTVNALCVSPDGQAIAFTRAEPRLPADEPGPARTHLYVLEQQGLDRKVSERLLLGGTHSVKEIAFDPQAPRVTFVEKGDGDQQPQVWAVAMDGKTERLFTCPSGVLSYRWRPDGKAIAFTTTDPVPESRAAAKKAGFAQTVLDEDFAHASLWLWEQSTGSLRRLTEGRTVLSFEWDPTGEQIAAGIAPRNLVDDSYVFTKLHRIDPKAGTVHPLVDNPGKLGHYAWSARGERLAYISAADRNDPHAGTVFVVDADGGPPRCLTPGFAGMAHQVRWTHQGQDEVLSAIVSVGVHSRVLTIDLETGALQTRDLDMPVTPAFTAMEGAFAGQPGRYFIGSTPTHPEELYGAGFGPGFQRLTDSNPWLEDVALGQQEITRFVARDGLEIEGLLLYPVAHRRGVRYPLVIVAHGGPEAHWSNGWLTSYSRWGQALCARGYFVWFPNYRASTGYGVQFAKADHGDPMGGEMRDHLDAIAHFAGRELIDPKRVGIGGGSYGGYTAAFAATRWTDHFAAAVSFVPFTDIRTTWMTGDIPLEMFFVHYQEQWPHEQPGLIADRSPLTWAHQCRTPLLLLGGLADPRVHPSQPLMLYRAVKLTGKAPTRLVQYPGEGHGNRSNVYQYDYLVRTIEWFDCYLEEGEHRQDPMPPLDLDYGAWLAAK